MGVYVTVRLLSHDDQSQPDPFFIENGAEWRTLETMLKALEVEDELEELRVDLDIRYWDGEDFVIVSSQEELDEAIRLAEEKSDILQLYVKPLNNSQPIVSTLEEEEACKERAPKRSAEEAFHSQTRAEADSEVDPSTPAVALLTAETLGNPNSQVLEAAAASVAASTQGDVSSAQKHEDKEEVEDVGASEQEHQMVPGALSGANVIAIEMPECPVEITMETPQEESRREPQGTEAAEPAEMAETGEVQPKSGRDAETGFWMVPKNDNKEEKTPKAERKPKDARPKDVRPKQRKQESKPDGSTEKPKKKRHPSESALTLEVFHDYMGKCKTDMTRDIVKDVTKKTVRRVVDAVCKRTPRAEIAVQTSDEDDTQTGQKRTQWPVFNHKSILCDNCDQAIVGIRYICGNCTNYDLCARCEDIYPPVHDASHAFIKLRTPCPNASVRHGVRSTLLKRGVYSNIEKEDEKKDQRELDKLSERFKIREAKIKLKMARREEKLKRMLTQYGFMRLYDPKHRDGILSAKFVADVTYPDGCVVKPGQFVEKIWTMQNDGTFAWPPDTFLEEVRTTMPANKCYMPVGTVLPGRYAAISVDFVAPHYPGEYESHWRLYAKSRVFGHSLFCKIRVEKPELEKEPEDSAVLVKWDTSSEDQVKGKKDQLGKFAASPLKNPKLEKKEQAYRHIEELLGRNSEGSAKQLLTVDECTDAIFRSMLQSEPGVNKDALQASLNTPSTPNNTPFAVSPPSGRCISPLPEELQPCEASNPAPKVIEVLNLETTAPEDPVPEARHSLESQSPKVDEDFQILDNRHFEGGDATVQQTSAEAGHEDFDDDNDSLPELLFCGYGLCPKSSEASLIAQSAKEEDGSGEEDEESADEELYTSASSPQTSKLDANLEMPIVGPSPVMPCEEEEDDSDLPCDDELPELLPMELVKKENEAALSRSDSREMSPGSTTSSVEVVSMADLEELEKGEDYTSIDTHGAWFAPSQDQPLCSVSEPLKDDCDFPTTEEVSSDSDDSSLDEDFCVVLPDCFDLSKPFKPHEENVEKMYRICFQDSDGKVSSQVQFARESSASADQDTYEEMFGRCDEEAACEKVLEPSRLEEVCPPEETKAVKGTGMPLRRTNFGQMDQKQGYDVTKDLLQSNQEMDNLVEFLTTKMKKLGDTGDEEQEEAGMEKEPRARDVEEGKQDGSQGGATEAANKAPEAEALNPAEPAVAKPEPAGEETALKTQAADPQQREVEEGATAAVTADDLFDPGQQLNQLMQNTVKAASSGLQHLYRTTKDVIKTLQADNYEQKESTYECKPTSFVLPKSTWTPPSTQYTPPRDDYQAPRSDFKVPQSTYTGPKTQESGKGGEYAKALQSIREMGFFNDERSLALLKKHKGDLQYALNELFTDMDNDWAGSRH